MCVLLSSERRFKLMLCVGLRASSLPMENMCLSARICFDSRSFCMLDKEKVLCGRK